MANNIRSAPSDTNGRTLVDRGREIYTKRLTGVNSTTGVTLSVPVDIKEIMIHYEGTDVVARRTGTVTDSEEIYLTRDGFTEVIPVVKEADVIVFNAVKATVGGTMNVSIMAWR